MIVVISHEGDVHATRVRERLSAWGLPVVLFDIAELPGAATLTIDYADPALPRAVLVPASGEAVELTRATAVWWRRPQMVTLDDIGDPDARGFGFGEWHEMLGGLNQLFRCPWMNPPAEDERASRKALQLTVAHSLGLTVPATMMTSDPDRARAFLAERGAGRTIYKIFAATQTVWRQTRIVGPDDVAALDSVRHAPVIFQELVPAVADIRVTIVGGQCFAMAIDTRGTSYEVDFRVSLSEAKTSAVTLPAGVEAALHALMRRFGIVYGAVDLRLTPDGDYVFLEINPAGEFLFVEGLTGLPLTDAVAAWLAAPRLCANC